MKRGEICKEGQSRKIRGVETLIAHVLQVPEDQITDDLAYRSIMAWDSLAHVNLMIALEKEYGVPLDADTIVELNSVAAIRAFVQQHVSHREESYDRGNEGREYVGIANVASMNSEAESSPQLESTGNRIAVKEVFTGTHDATTICRGLAGVIFDRTRTTLVDRQGKLLYRGYSIHDLVAHSTFEETAYLLLYGALPNREELNGFDSELKAARSVPAPILEVIRMVQHAHPMEVLRTAVSALATFDVHRGDNSAKSLQQKAIRLIAQIPTLVAAHQAIRRGKQPLLPSPTLSHAANFLYMIHGEIPNERAVQTIDKILILHADHGSNASAFAARVVAGTRSDLYATLTAAIAAFAGSLHGGAIENVLTMVQEIGEPDRAAEYVARLQSKNEPIMGFGHRVYQTEDPRARHLRQAAYELSVQLGEKKWYDILEAVVNAMRSYVKKGVDVNVDFYASIIYHLLGIPQDLFVAAFAIGRMPGWISQVKEQFENNILIRPLLQYVGETDSPYLPIDQRDTRGRKSS
ncbi:citrate/2-methylcitrate synthase [Numidum massiliense]|uniref:citrate/2-methylcitrate synthase n=1 Tax=Numidum massiliense TaxID=1522315 RepID=UPI00093F38D7|nr:citrate/2-methylcitrate synthase [Numidum massiliense]